MRIALFILICHIAVSASVHVQPISDSIAIKVSSFETENIVGKTLTRLKKYNLSDARSLIIDLRDNTGGYIYEAIGFAALFINKSNLIQVLDKENAPLTITRPIDHPMIHISQLYLVINNKTASAAEAAAYILSQHPNVTIIGKQSYGKLSISGDTTSPSPYSAIIIPNNRIIPTIEKSIENKAFDSAMLSVLAAKQTLSALH